MKNSFNIKTIIIEDNNEAKEYLEHILEQDDNIEIIGHADNIQTSIEIIDRLKPELILMDIELTDGYSFKIFDNLSFKDFEVIFITAFDNFHQKAMEHYALSYLMKPVDPFKLTESIQRYLNIKERTFSHLKLKSFQNFISVEESKFLIHAGSEHLVIKLSQIIKCKANGNYTDFYLSDGRKKMASKSLKYYSELLSDKGFFKAHRSLIVNVDFISSIYKKEAIILSNNETVQVSVRNRSKLSELINHLS